MCTKVQGGAAFLTCLAGSIESAQHSSGSEATEEMGRKETGHDCWSGHCHEGNSLGSSFKGHKRLPQNSYSNPPQNIHMQEQFHLLEDLNTD